MSSRPGSPAPEGYVAWHEWADVQHKAGLRQQACSKCGRWKFPQELASEEQETQVAYRTERDAQLQRNPIETVVNVVVCKECESRQDLNPQPVEVVKRESPFHYTKLHAGRNKPRQD